MLKLGDEKLLLIMQRLKKAMRKLIVKYPLSQYEYYELKIKFYTNYAFFIVNVVSFKI